MPAVYGLTYLYDVIPEDNALQSNAGLPEKHSFSLDSAKT